MTRWAGEQLSRIRSHSSLALVSSLGRAWEALREDEIACRSLGINTTAVKLTAFATGAMFGGFAGSEVLVHVIRHPCLAVQARGDAADDDAGNVRGFQKTAERVKRGEKRERRRI